MLLTANSLKKIERASKSSDNQQLLSNMQKEIEKNDQELLSTITTSYSQIIDFCITLNGVNESLDNLIELNNQSNSYLQDTAQKIQMNLEELRSIDETEKNIDVALTTLQKIDRFNTSIETLQDITDICELVAELGMLERCLLDFKKFGFYSKFNLRLIDNRDKIFKRIKNNVKEWMRKVGELFNFLGSEFVRMMNNEHSMIFDFRYNLMKNVPIQEVYDFLYIFGTLKDRREIIDKMNYLRKNSTFTLMKDHDAIENDIYNVIGFLLVDFYLLDIDISFDLKENYGNLVHRLLQNIKNKKSDIYEHKNDLLVLKEALVALNYRYKDVEDELFKIIFTFFQEEKANITTFSDIESYISKCKKIMENYSIKDIRMLFYKNVDDLLLEYFCLDEDYLVVLDRICGEFVDYKFRAQNKKSREITSNYNRIKDYHLKVIDKALDERDFERFNQLIQNETSELNDIKLNSNEKKELINDMKAYCMNKLQRREKLDGPKEKVNFNAKKALLMKMFEQNLHL
ncbi:hypothetical protein THOM_0567 [Trachipleistophora hominis]|uniref:Uncharacterized protein n=1 Tax=Trachipleistophora hominis TaxID=72359 RepID=L7JYB0_TRAHO|nr:hypothetical protein THOM_0567 [Trachipleistophora hominis]